MWLPPGTIEQRIHHLNDLVATAERRREDLDSKLCSGTGHGRETERQRDLWDRRAKMLRKMRMGLEQMSEYPSDSNSYILFSKSNRNITDKVMHIWNSTENKYNLKITYN